MSEPIELKPCPFCGAEGATVTPRQCIRSQRQEGRSIWVAVRCEAQGCGGAHGIMLTPEEYQGLTVTQIIARAAEAWNRRQN